METISLLYFYIAYRLFVLSDISLRALYGDNLIPLTLLLSMNKCIVPPVLLKIRLAKYTVCRNPYFIRSNTYPRCIDL